jgi:peptide-methionine (R)-S-oxide reductase
MRLMMPGRRGERAQSGWARAVVCALLCAGALSAGGCWARSTPAKEAPAAPADQDKTGGASAPADAKAPEKGDQEFKDMTDMRARPDATRPTTLPGEVKVEKMNKSDAEWERLLNDEEFYILRNKGTERAFTGKYWKTKSRAEQQQDKSVYHCRGCGQELFRADSKFDSGCGWPSFDRMLQSGVIKEITDTTNGWVRTEVVCARCEGHLGHLFSDGPTETGLRYCINSASILHEGDKKAAEPKSDEKK